MHEFEIETLRGLLREIKKKEMNKNANVEDVTVEFFDGGLYVRSYIDDKVVNKRTIEFQVVDEL